MQPGDRQPRLWGGGLDASGKGRRLPCTNESFSYSHHDAAWRTRLAELIGGGVYLERFELWFDTEIEASDNWKQRIDAAIAARGLRCCC